MGYAILYTTNKQWYFVDPYVEEFNLLWALNMSWWADVAEVNVVGDNGRGKYKVSPEVCLRLLRLVENRTINKLESTKRRAKELCDVLRVGCTTDGCIVEI